MKCAKCKRRATMSNLLYFPDIWYCTFHGNIEIKEGRRKRKQLKQAINKL